MRKLVVTENITVDGVIDMAAGWFDLLAKDVDQSDIIATNAEHSAAADALLVGRNTFEAFPRLLAEANRRSDRCLRLSQPRQQVRGLSHNWRPGLAEHHCPAR